MIDKVKIEMLQQHIEHLNGQIKAWEDLSLKKDEIIEAYKSMLSTHIMTKASLNVNQYADK